MQAVGRVLTTDLFDLKVFGLRNIPAQGGALIVSNHQSNLDPILLGARVPRPLSYMAKSELFEMNPLLTELFRLLGGFPVHQGAGDVKAVKESIQRLREGHLLSIFPEGGRTMDGEIGKMEKGVALIVRRAGVPVIPAAIVGAYEAWPYNRTVPRRWPIRVQFGPAMKLADKKPGEILATIDRTLREMFDELRNKHHAER